MEPSVSRRPSRQATTQRFSVEEEIKRLGMNFQDIIAETEYIKLIQDINTYAKDNNKEVILIGIDTKGDITKAFADTRRDAAMYKSIIAACRKHKDVPVISIIGCAHIYEPNEKIRNKRLGSLLLKNPDVILELENFYIKKPDLKGVDLENDAYEGVRSSIDGLKSSLVSTEILNVTIDKAFKDDRVDVQVKTPKLKEDIQKKSLKRKHTKREGSPDSKRIPSVETQAYKEVPTEYSNYLTRVIAELNSSITYDERGVITISKKEASKALDKFKDSIATLSEEEQKSQEEVIIVYERQINEQFSNKNLKRAEKSALSIKNKQYNLMEAIEIGNQNNIKAQTALHNIKIASIIESSINMKAINVLLARNISGNGKDRSDKVEEAFVVKNQSKPTINIVAEDDHRKQHGDNVREFEQQIKNGIIDENTVILLERKAYGDNLGMQDVIKLANIIEHNEKNADNQIKIPEEIQKNPMILADAQMHKVARDNGIKVIGLEGSNLLAQKDSPKEHNQNREQYMAAVITEVQSRGYNVVVNIGSAHEKSIRERLSQLQTQSKPIIEEKHLKGLSNISRKLRQEDDQQQTKSFITSSTSYKEQTSSPHISSTSMLSAIEQKTSSSSIPKHQGASKENQIPTSSIYKINKPLQQEIIEIRQKLAKPVSVGSQNKSSITPMAKNQDKNIGTGKI